MAFKEQLSSVKDDFEKFVRKLKPSELQGCANLMSTMLGDLEITDNTLSKTIKHIDDVENRIDKMLKQDNVAGNKESNTNKNLTNPFFNMDKIEMTEQEDIIPQNLRKQSDIPVIQQSLEFGIQQTRIENCPSRD